MLYRLVNVSTSKHYQRNFYNAGESKEVYYIEHTVRKTAMYNKWIYKL